MKVSKIDFNKAKQTIKRFEKQTNESRQKSFLDRLTHFDDTYWKYTKPMQEIYMHARLTKESILVATQYIINSNGILEVNHSQYNHESLNNYLRTLSEYSHDELFDDEKYLFKSISESVFKNVIRIKVLRDLELEFTK